MEKKLSYKGPVVLVVMDGVGLAPDGAGNAVKRAHTEFLDFALENYLNIPLEASGEAVGILKGDMGNSEVGHNALGSGQIVKQGIAQVEDYFKTGKIYEGETWHKIIDNVVKIQQLKNPKPSISPASFPTATSTAPSFISNA